VAAQVVIWWLDELAAAVRSVFKSFELLIAVLVHLQLAFVVVVRFEGSNCV